MKPHVLVILGSTRAGRQCPRIAAWVVEIGRQATDLDYEIVDLADWRLPSDDEPGIPAMGVYAQDHTRAWSRRVGAAQGFVFVTPQYNWGYPAPLKNAIDHLHDEWTHKPLVIVTYGGHGGTKCAAQLRQVAEGLDMRPVATMPALPLGRPIIKGEVAVDPAKDFAAQADDVRRALKELDAMLKTDTAATVSGREENDAR